MGVAGPLCKFLDRIHPCYSIASRSTQLTMSRIDTDSD